MAHLSYPCLKNLDADLEQCSSVPLPPLEKVLLLGWYYEQDLSHVELKIHDHALQRKPGVRLTKAVTPHPSLKDHQSL